MRHSARRITGKIRSLRLTSILTVVAWALAVVIAVVGLGSLVASNISEKARADGNQAVINSLRERVASKDDDLTSLLESYTSLYDDCEQAEGCDSEAPAPEVIERVLPVEGPQGEPGRAPTSSEIDDAVVRYCLLRTECRGEVGAAGTNGTDGASGSAGQPGANGQAGADGATGSQGPAGETGAPGQDGADGQPPVSWTYDDALGFTHTCTRTDPFDASAPTYTCN